MEDNMETMGVYRNIQGSVPDLRLRGFGVRDPRFGVCGSRFGTQERPIPYDGKNNGPTWIYGELPDDNHLQQESPIGPLR